MTAAGITFDDTFARELVGMYEPWRPAIAPEPRALVINEPLAVELGLDPDWLASPEGVDLLVGNVIHPTSRPIAQAYSGHQFGGFSPRLGDGRAVLLGEIVDTAGQRHDLHLKGSGRTPFSRGGDGKAAVGPMLREYVIGEAMHALGIPTTRALAVVATGETIARDSMLPGAVLARVAASHLRVGTFQYAALTGDVELLGRLTRHAIARHHPQVADADVPALALLAAVCDVQASLVARWMHVGFVHGVMNTDNTTISGETIDYGPCAFIDRFDPSTVFSSIDHGGRYAYGNQPNIVHWNLARLAEALLPLIDDDTERAVDAAMSVLERFPSTYTAAWQSGLRAKLGLREQRPGDPELFAALVESLQMQQVDQTRFFRALSSAVLGDRDRVRVLARDLDGLDAWLDRWQERRLDESQDPTSVTTSMDAVNPAVIPRNHLVEAALTAATAGDLGPVVELVDAIRLPFDRRPGFERYELPAPADAGRHVTYCGT